MISDIKPMILGRDANGIVEFMKNVFMAGCPTDDDVAALKKAGDLLKICSANACAKSEALSKVNAGAAAGGLGTLRFKIENLQFMEPRGRFNARFYEHGMTLENKTFCGTVLWQNALNVICVVNTMTAKKDSEDLIVVHTAPEKINGKVTKNILFAANRLTNVTSEAGDVTGTVSEVIQQVVSAASGLKIGRPSNSLFCSAKGAPFVKGYHGIQEGSIYLLGAGILFLKPVIFVPVAEVAGVVAGRGGAANTRYIDLKVETESNEEFEFSNLDRDELVNIQSYVQYLGALRDKHERAAAVAVSSSAARPVLDLDDIADEDESDDDDYDPYAISDNEEGGAAAVGSASGSGSGTDDDSDDDSDFDGSGSGSDESGFVSEGSVELSGAEDQPTLEPTAVSGSKKRTRSSVVTGAVAPANNSSSNSSKPGRWCVDVSSSNDASSSKRLKVEGGETEKANVTADASLIESVQVATHSTTSASCADMIVINE